jgi:hypothetical protein
MPADTRVYVLPDEPTGSGFVRLAVQPLWPLLSVMLVGPWLSWPWFWLNAVALGAPDRLRTGAAVAAGFAGSAAMVVAIGMLVDSGVPEGLVPYLAIAITVWKLGVSYLLHHWQSRTVEVHQLYGGKLASGSMVLLLAWFLSDRVSSSLSESALLSVVLLP